ncbi:MAG: flagellar protein FlaG [Deltaproteobacteria bacterium]|nr:flagellar protein FlaG [Deltaproteobacteria bacterium]
MAFSAIKPVDHSIDQGLSAPSHMTTSEPVNSSASEINFYRANTEKRSKEIKKATDEKIAHITELVDSYVRSIQKDIKIQVNSDTGDISVKVISEETGKVIREIPSQEMLALAARMEEISGVLFDQKV